MTRVFNFASGPGAMPETILRQGGEAMLDWNGHGCSILEMPFTSQAFRELVHSARERLRALLAIPPHYRILFLHGGASAQFALVPLNLLGQNPRADYLETGHWSSRAIAEGQRYCTVNIAASAREHGFSRMPRQDELQLNATAAYCHYTSNETADGVQFHHIPDSGDIPLVADMTSDFLTRPLDMNRFGMIYAASQKNIGPAGFTVVVIREDLLDRAAHATPKIFNYRAQNDADSLLNTPVTFAIYLADLVFRWIEAQGGLAAMERNAVARSHRLYRAIDGSNGFYRCPVAPCSRSRINVCFTLADAALTPLFLQQAAGRGLVNLQGHAMSGGLRASLYNAMSEQGVAALTEFMQRFAEEHATHV